MATGDPVEAARASLDPAELEHLTAEARAATVQEVVTHATSGAEEGVPARAHRRVSGPTRCPSS